MTYSIVARDPESGALGVAVQSHFFGVGRIVTWAEAGVGAVATQSFALASYGPLGLRLMRAGAAAPDALAELVAADADSEVRQVAFVDAAGRSAAHTGARCVEAAGHAAGEGVSAQANMMLRSTVWGAMLEAFSGPGEFVERLLAALDAAEAEGGDIRGRQSAALLVVDGTRDDRPWEHVTCDLRVDDHPEPLAELRRLVAFDRAYRLLGEALFTPGIVTGEPAGDLGAALPGLEEAERILGDNREASLWRCVLLARAGRLEEARALLRLLGERSPQLAEFVARLPRAGLLPEEAYRTLSS